ncbi:hypothetical protein [Streptomyces sp. NBC_01506]|uniref:hypothetical protein n=1 Tax=Streptomyces sp. NBC_01506 TaxID=2903887 RepID=UPI00386A7401
MSDAPNDDALHTALPDEDLLKALAPYTAMGGGAGAAPGRLRDVTRRQLVRCTVVRFTERRTETQRTAFGTKDLSALPLYEGALADHPLSAPEKPGTLTLLRAHSHTPVPCPCDNGTQQCTGCSGSGRHACTCRNEPPACDVCLDVSPCTECEKNGRRRTRTAKVRPAATGARATSPGARRVTCAVCATSEAACPGCSGRGRVRCRHCEGRGRETCGRCSGTGVRPHEVCGGEGSITHWVEGTVAYAHETASLSLPRPDWPDKVRERLAATGRWQSHDVPADGALPTGVHDTHRAALANHLGGRKAELSRRVTLETCPLARVVLMDDPEPGLPRLPRRAGPPGRLDPLERTETAPDRGRRGHRHRGGPGAGGGPLTWRRGPGSVPVADSGAGRVAEVLDRPVQGTLALLGERGIGECGVVGRAGDGTRASVGAHPSDDAGKLLRRVGDALGGGHDGVGPLDDHDFDGAVNLARQRDETAELLVEIDNIDGIDSIDGIDGIRGARPQGRADGVHGDVPVVERAEVAHVRVTTVLAAPLVTLRPRLGTAVDQRGAQRGERTDRGAEQCGESCVHGPSLPPRPWAPPRTPWTGLSPSSDLTPSV